MVFYSAMFILLGRLVSQASLSRPGLSHPGSLPDSWDAAAGTAMSHRMAAIPGITQLSGDHFIM